MTCLHAKWISFLTVFEFSTSGVQLTAVTGVLTCSTYKSETRFYIDSGAEKVGLLMIFFVSPTLILSKWMLISMVLSVICLVN